MAGDDEVSKPAKPGAVERIIKGLAQQPAYLLVFGLCFILLGGGSATGIVGAFKDSSLAWVGATVSALALIAAVIVVLAVERQGQGTPMGKIGDTDFDPIMDGIRENIAKALGKSHPVFRDEMEQECERFRLRASFWAAGQLRTSERGYNGLLLSVYERAEKEVFCTSTIDYLQAWQSILGDDILKAHVSGKAKVTRVFIFESRETVLPEAIEVMKKQAATGKIAVRVYGIREHVRYTFPPNMNLNFAVVDEGDIVASTDPAAAATFTGTFYFKEAGFRESYKEVVNQLVRGSIGFEEFMARHDPSWTPPSLPITRSAPAPAPLASPAPTTVVASAAPLDGKTPLQ